MTSRFLGWAPRAACGGDTLTIPAVASHPIGHGVGPKICVVIWTVLPVPVSGLMWLPRVYGVSGSLTMLFPPHLTHTLLDVTRSGGGRRCHGGRHTACCVGLGVSAGNQRLSVAAARACCAQRFSLTPGMLAKSSAVGHPMQSWTPHAMIGPRGGDRPAQCKTF